MAAKMTPVLRNTGVSDGSTREALLHVKHDLLPGIDWITCTLVESNLEKSDTFKSWRRLFDAIARETNAKLVPAGWQGYKGIGMEGALLGTREDGACFRMTGAMAAKNWNRIRGGKATRLDLQVTVIGLTEVGGKFNVQKLPPHLWHGDQAENANRDLPDDRKRLISYNHNNKGGATLYIGSRQSSSFARIYDKSAESPGEWGGYNAWRYEVQFGKRLAQEIRETLMEQSSGGLERSIIAAVWDWMRARGVFVPWSRGDGPALKMKEELEPKTTDRQLAWLHKQVAPTIRKLQEEGLEGDAIIALFGLERGLSIIAAMESGFNIRDTWELDEWERHH